MLIVALQVVGPHGTEDGSNAPDAERGSQQARVEQDLLLMRFQMVGHVVRVDVEVLEWEGNHWQHGSACKDGELEDPHFLLDFTFLNLPIFECLS